jgi:2-succinyl-5-enolpyruvyl-6-hydroxy-3-cyclohexene-1-carboxylate synthase
MGSVRSLGNLSRPKTPTTPDLSREVPHEGATHVDPGTVVSYVSNPPTSGSHWPVPLQEGLYDTEKPDEAIVHSMEHGRVWVSYNPRVSEDVVSQLKKLLANQLIVILTPRSGNETDIALAAWNRLDTFNIEGTLDAQRVLDFVTRYKNKGPETVPPGARGASQY